jgi:hypothetical protein
MKQPNRVKAAMRAGRKAYGYNLSFPSPWVIDILGKLDFDFVFIDGEHGPFGLDQLEDLCRTAERHNLTTIARVPDIGSSTQDNAGNHPSHPTGRAHDAIGRDASGVGQRYAARRGSPYSVTVVLRLSQTIHPLVHGRA